MLSALEKVPTHKSFSMRRKPQLDCIAGTSNRYLSVREEDLNQVSCACMVSMNVAYDLNILTFSAASGADFEVLAADAALAVVTTVQSVFGMLYS